jgi:two-component sensor histidine kinase
VGSIALVHETLSQSIDEAVAFDEIADRLRDMVTDLGSADATVRTARRGSFGTLPGQVAASLAMVLTELLQNATEHGFAGGDGTLEVVVERADTGEASTLRVAVRDDGQGLPRDFDPAHSRSLGLSIVRTLVESELGGVFRLGPRTGGGTEAEVVVPLP